MTESPDRTICSAIPRKHGLLRSAGRRLLIAALVAFEAGAQATLVAEPGCAACSVESRVVATLGTTDGQGALTGLPRAATVDSRGRFWLLFPAEAPMLFAADGSFLSRVGQRGEGPGEFRSPWKAFPVGDSVAVLEQVGDVKVFAPDLTHVRTVSGGANGASSGVGVLSWPREVAVAALSRRRDATGHTLRVIDYSGRIAQELRAFGGDGPLPADDANLLLRGGVSQEMRQQLAIASSGEAIFAATRYSRYEVTRWSDAGMAGWRIARRADFFPASDTWSMGSAQSPPDARIDAAHFSAGRLWVFGVVAAEHWQQFREVPAARARATPPAGGGTRIGGVSPTSLSVDLRIYVTLVEVFDANTGALRATARIPGFLAAALPDGRILSYRETTDGIPVLDVVALQFRGAGRQR